MKNLEERINTISKYYKNKYKKRMFRIGLSIQKTCPHQAKNGGCIFCLPNTFTDANLDKIQSVKDQIDYLIPKIEKKCGQVGYIAYFQDNTSTYGDPEFLKRCFLEADNHQMIDEIIISTRPDYLNSEMIKIFSCLNKPLTIEIGIQTIHDKSLLFLNRNHTQQDNEDSINLLKEHDIRTGVHLILGIPCETTKDVMETIYWINLKKISEVKLHHLIAYEGTKLGDLFINKQIKFPFSSFEDYLLLLSKIILKINPNCNISRFFTSNLNQTMSALNQFPGIKKIWLNELTKYLNQHDIHQGTEYLESK